MNKNNDMSKTITFSIHDDERALQAKQTLKAVYEALSERGYNPVDQIVEYILTEEPTYITNYKNARSMVRRIDRYELLSAMLKEYLGL